MSASPRIFFLRAWLVLLAAGLAVWPGCGKSRSGGDDDDKKPAAKTETKADAKDSGKDAKDAAPASDDEGGGRVTLEDGESAVKMTLEEMQHNGIVAEKLPEKTWRPAYHAVGFVQDLSALVDASSTWSEAQVGVTKSEAALSASNAEYERLKQLNAQQQNVSIKDLQSAEAAWRGDDAAYRAAESVRAHRAALLTAQWGSVIAQWIQQDAPELQALLKGEKRLVRVSAPTAPDGFAPKEARVLGADRKWVPLDWISATAQADPDFQKPAYYFSLPATAGLLPGMTVEALIVSDAPEAKGVSVPAGAIVHWQGKAWIYEQTQPELFLRKEISLDQPDDTGGYFVSDPVLPDPVATYGAQMILTEEFHPAPGGD